MINTIKRRTYFVSLAPLLPPISRVHFFALVLNKWWAILVIEVRVEYKVPNFEMAISFELRLEHVKYAYHWNRQGIKSLKSGKLSIRFNFKTLKITLSRLATGEGRLQWTREHRAAIYLRYV